MGDSVFSSVLKGATDGLPRATRREFLRRTSALSALGAAAPWALNLATLGSASAAVANDYRALVCVFLYGGNDTYNTVLATDSASWSAYTTTRNQQPDPISLLAPGTAPDSGSTSILGQLGGVLPITPSNSQGRSFALHPSLSRIQQLFNNKRVGIVANVGPLLSPTTKANYDSASFAKPSKLFSHNDQQSTWQSFAPEGANAGWGGRMAEVWLNGATPSLFTAVSAAGNTVWLSGRNVLQYQVSNTGVIAMGGTSLFGSAGVSTAMKSIVQGATTADYLAQDHAAVAARALDAEGRLSSVMPPVSQAPWGSATSQSNDALLKYTSPLTGAATLNSLAQQLQAVARMIHAGNALGLKRQVFLVSLGGFDTHDNQNRAHADLMAKLDHGLGYFDTVLQGMGADNQVVTFTASDFGRTFTSNGDGTDHGWGAHHFVMGGAVNSGTGTGAVNGGDIYGTFPQYSVADANGNFSSPNQLRNGALLPGVSVDQYAYTLARWFGVSDSDLVLPVTSSGKGFLPNITAFDSSVRNLGFLKTV